MSLNSTVNKVILAGTVAGNLKTHPFKNGITAIYFALLTKETIGKGLNVFEHSEMHNIKLLSNNPEQAKQDLQRGASVYIEGRIKTQTSVDAQGMKRFTIEIFTQSYLLFTCTNQSVTYDPLEF